MKRILASLLVIMILLGCTACGSVHTCENPCKSCGLCLTADCTDCPEKCPGHHICSSVCDTCGLCLNKSCAESVCQEKCAGHHVCISLCGTCGLCTNAGCTDIACAGKCQSHVETPYEFSTGDYITTEPVSIDTGTFVYDLGPNIFVRSDLQAITDVIVATMEQVSGLDFDGAGYGQMIHTDGKIHINISRDFLYVGQDWYQGSMESEVASASASPARHVEVSPGDLFLGSSAIVHEAAHVLMFRQSEWSHCQLLNEGISTYTTYLVEKALESSDQVTGFCIHPPRQSILDMEIYDYNKLYEHPLEYWFENTFEYSGNANYVIGFRFMAYLQDVYGNYTEWVTKFEEMYSFRNARTNSNESPVAQQIEVLKATYGDDVLDNFYPWLKEHQAEFDVNYDASSQLLSNAQGINLYPTFNAIESRAKIENFQYNNLHINLETVRFYLSEYKKLDASDLTLSTSTPVSVNLYYSDGTHSSVTTESQISLSGVSSIQLVGEGTLSLLEIRGSFRYYYED